MDYFTSSIGILSNPQIPSLFSINSVKKLPRWRQPVLSSQDRVIGWGYKPNTEHSRKLAKEYSVPYLALEDGFISWLNHPTQSKASDRLSYIVDSKGIYYDSSKPSGLDDCINNPSCIDESRVQKLIGQLTHLGVSKYNQPRQRFPKWLNILAESSELKMLLLVDQTYGDASISYAGGSSKSFTDMLSWAVEKLKADSTYSLVIKTHPDVLLGKKKGYLTSTINDTLLNQFKNRIHLLTTDVSPKELISVCSEVATVSSQLGFESLLYQKPVTCFAWPFYAGRGLTTDKCGTPLTYSRESISLSRLVQAALIDYPTYLDPETQEICNIEVVVNYLQAHFVARNIYAESLVVPNVSLWKRSFIPEFISRSAGSLAFDSKVSPKKTELIWGMKSSVLPKGSHSIFRMEDGFIRSVGLGADLRRPSSLVLDDEGIYYNGKQASRLETLLNNCNLTEYDLQRATNLKERLIDSAVTKYNVDTASDTSGFREKAGQKEIILVTGQFQQDLSMEFGAVDIKDNLSLLKVVRSEFPKAYIIFKEHPDVYSGVRPGRLNDKDVMNYADEYLTDTSLLSLFMVVDRVCTICSLSGFEALCRGVKVNTYGLPFYGGWGLTSDRHEFPRRKKLRSIEELAFISLVLYARYINWNTRKLTTPEYIISAISQKAKGIEKLKSNWFSRQIRKIHYLLQSLLKFSENRMARYK